MFEDIVNGFCSLNVMVVKITDQGLIPLGSGFICHGEYFLTSAHLFNLTDTLGVVLTDIKTQLYGLNEFQEQTVKELIPYKVIIKQYDAYNDVALLKYDSTALLPYMTSLDITCSKTDSNVGKSVGYFGYPFCNRGLHNLSFSETIISSKVISSNSTKQYQLDTMVHDGNSGGPLIDIEKKKIIGIITGRFSPTGNNSGASLGGYKLGTESSISYATSIEYGLKLLQNEGIK